MKETKKQNKKVSKIAAFFGGIKNRLRLFLAHRPHRSFRLTPRRDYKRTLVMPGYWAFTNEVRRTLWQNRRLFLGVVLIYTLLSVVAVGMISQDTYSELSDYLQEAGAEVVGGNVGMLTRALVVFGATVMGDLNGGTLSEAQQLYSALLALLCWLTVVWLLRQRLAGHKVKLRDGIYSSGSPIVASLIVLLVVIVQLLPLAIGFIGLQTAQASGIAQGGVEAMLLWFVIGLLGVLSLYWLTGSLIGFVLVTLPGMYPFKALKEAGELVLGRRLRLMLRLVWLMAIVVITWAVVLIPIILLDRLLHIEWLPLVPVAVVLVGALTVVWTATYIYLLYRKLIDA